MYCCMEAIWDKIREGHRIRGCVEERVEHIVGDRVWSPLWDRVRQLSMEGSGMVEIHKFKRWWDRLL